MYWVLGWVHFFFLFFSSSLYFSPNASIFEEREMPIVFFETTLGLYMLFPHLPNYRGTSHVTKCSITSIQYTLMEAWSKQHHFHECTCEYVLMWGLSVLVLIMNVAFLKVGGQKASLIDCAWRAFWEGDLETQHWISLTNRSWDRIWIYWQIQTYVLETFTHKHNTVPLSKITQECLQRLFLFLSSLVLNI